MKKYIFAFILDVLVIFGFYANDFCLKNILFTSSFYSAFRNNNDGEYSFYQNAVVSLCGSSVRILWKVPFSKFTIFPNLDKLGGGLSFNLKLLGIPIEIKAGNLNITGSISKMNSPYFGSTVSLKNPVFKSCSLNVLPPGFSSIEKPFAISVKYSYKKWYGYLKRAECLFFCDINKTFCASGLIFLGKNDSLSFSFTAGNFRKENKINIKNNLFSDKALFAANFQTSLYLYLSKLKININMFEQLSQDFKYTFLIENTFNPGYFIFDTSIFFTSSNNIFISSSFKELKTLFQIKFSPQYIFFMNNNKILKLGTIFILEEKIKSRKEKIVLGKAGAGVNFYGLKNKLNINFYASKIEFSKPLSEIKDERFIFNQKIFEKADLNFSAYFRKDIKYSPELDAVFSYPLKHNTSSSVKISISGKIPNYIKKTEISSKAALKISKKSSISMSFFFKKRFKRLNITGSAEFIYNGI